jgi:zinc transport system permease protein
MNWEEIFEALSYPFVLRALVAGLLVSLCAAMLGVVLVLKRYAMIGHGLSEVGFASLSVAAALGLPPLFVAAPLVIAASFAVMFVSQRKRIGGDVAVGIASSAALAAGVLVTAATRGINMDIYNYMFGSVLAMTNEDVVLCVTLSIFVVGVFVFFYNRLFLIAYDEDFARSLGIGVTRYQFLISLLTALTVVLGMRMMGTLLISSLIVMPAVTARKLVRSFKGLVTLSAIISVVCFILGLTASFILDLPAGASIVAANLAALFAARFAVRPIRRFT